MKKAAILFGLNYKHISGSELEGCINDVKNVATFLEQTVKIPKNLIEIYTDDENKGDTGLVGIIKRLYQFAVKTWVEKLDLVWIHYSGHGSYMNDTNNDEIDGLDECICPSDYTNFGFIKDDLFSEILKSFNPRTEVIIIMDSCHSGTMGDLKYLWNTSSEQIIDGSNTNGRICMISGSMDEQKSADSVFNGKPEGALTHYLLEILNNKNEFNKATNDIFYLVKSINNKLSSNGFTQVSLLSSSVDLTLNDIPKWFLPPNFNK